MPQRRHEELLSVVKNGELIENRQAGEGITRQSLLGTASYIWLVRNKDGTEAVYSTNEMAPKG